jgi:DNA primase
VQEIAKGVNTIVTEGVIDTLTAIVKWPGRTVLGAHGAGQLTAIVEAAAPRVKATGGKLVLVPDGDDVGKRQMVRAGEKALAAGLVMDSTLIVVEVAPHRDLNEAHCKGWKL